jgi:predicted Ser/Thr protein kinase
VETYGLPVVFVIKVREELRRARPAISHKELDRFVRHVAMNAPDWMIDYSDGEEDA